MSAGRQSAASAAGEVRAQWVHLFRPGRTEARDGRRFNLVDPGAVVARTLENAGTGELPVDYEHQTDYAPTNGRPAPAAGWMKRFEVRSDGIWALVQWTTRAAKMLADGEYRYISPTFSHSPSGEVRRIERAALTNNPALQLTALARRQPQRQGPIAMSFSKSILDALDLPADASESDAIAGILHLKNAHSAGSTDSGNMEAVATAVMQLNAERQAVAMARIERKVGEAVSAGVFPPSLRGWALALARTNEGSFDEFIDKVGKPFAHLFAHQITPEMEELALARRRDGGHRQDDTDNVARQLGIDPKKLRD